MIKNYFFLSEVLLLTKNITAILKIKKMYVFRYFNCKVVIKESLLFK